MPEEWLAQPWLPLAALALLAGTAAVLDLRTLRIPNWLSVATLALGLLYNVVSHARAAGTASGSPWLGALGGVWFAFQGFALGFALFLVLWLLGTCGGGDVKLVAALGAWLGVRLLLVVLLASVVLVVLFAAVRLAGGRWARGPGRAVKAYPRRETPPGEQAARRRQSGGQPRPPRRLVSYSLPLAVSTVGVLALKLMAGPKP
jgi:prepilin peptidase CpaA